jgi:CTP synthase
MRNVVGYKEAHTTEINPDTKYPVIDLLPEQKNVMKLGGTMRLGSYKIIIKEGTLAHSIYGYNEVFERHRHRYGVNPKYIPILEENGLIISGISYDEKNVEFIEIKNHPFFFASQAHPEFKSRPGRPSPPFLGFI